MKKLRLTNKILDNLAEDFQEIVLKMFPLADHITVESEFTHGLGVSRVFLINYQLNDYDKQAVVKFAPANRITTEWQAYNTCMPPIRGITQIKQEPVFSSNGLYGGLHLSLAGSSKYTVRSLYDYANSALVNDILSDVLEDELFNYLQIVWSKRKKRSRISWLHSYGYLLPPYLHIVQTEPPSENAVNLINPQNIATGVFNRGDFVSIQGMQINSKNETSLNLCFPNNRKTPYRIEFEPYDKLSSDYLPDALLERVNGVIIKTRYDVLIEHAEKALGSSLNLSDSNLEVSHTVLLPNPIKYVWDLLKGEFSGFIGCIHGDLNLENILIEYSGNDFMPYLIDFDNTRQDHLLHDPLCLEAKIMTRLLPPLLAESNESLEIIYSFYKNLHNHVVNKHPFNLSSNFSKPFKIIDSIRKVARVNFANKNDWNEYYHGLILYLVGALKYASLDLAPTAPLPKQVALCAAASMVQILKESKNFGRTTN